MKKILLLIVGPAIICLFCVLWYANFRLARHPRIELVTTIECPATFDNSSFHSINIASDEEQLMWWLSGSFQKPSAVNLPIDSVAIRNAAKLINFKEYDCMIAFHRKPTEVSWSPYLTRQHDGCYPWAEAVPLIVCFDTITTQQIFLYHIRPKHKFRGLCP